MLSIRSAVIQALQAHSDVVNWATGGIFAKRAPGVEEGDVDTIRDRYITVRVEASSVTGTQTEATEHVIDRLAVRCWGKNALECDDGIRRVKDCLDKLSGTVEELSIQRISWAGTVDDEEEPDLAMDEELIDAVVARFDCAYTIPIGS